MKIITFRLMLEEPILVTSFQGDPNSDVSYGYIPGSAIRGALIGRYLQAHPNIPADILVDAQVRALFFEDGTRFLNAYLTTTTKKQPRSLPLPLSWRHEKDEESTILDQSCKPEDLEEEIEPKKLVSFGKQFCSIDHNVRLYREQRRINIHNQRNRSKGRPTTNVGEIYRYESLAPGQSFEAVILCNQNDHAEILEALLKQQEILRIGGSQTAGYGKTIISQIQSLQTWSEVGLVFEKRASYHSKCLKITLLSDAIIFNEQGQYTIEPPIEPIQEHLSIKISKPSKSYMGNVPVGGFNRKWGLPLPQVQAISAGSVFVFEGLQPTPEQVQALEWEGIGERRNEGFGRVVVNWLPEQYEFQIEKPPAIRKDAPNLSPQSQDYAHKMASRLLRQKLDIELEQQLCTWTLTGGLTNSQLSRLMLAANQALVEKNITLMNDFFDNLRSNAKTKFETAKLGSDLLEHRLKTWLSDWTTTAWKDKSITVAGVKAEVDQELANEYTLRLMIAISRKGMKQNSLTEH
jgi:CRISPR-associated protein Csx10